MKESMRESKRTCSNVFKDSLVKFSAKTHNLSVESKRIDVMENRRVTHFIVNDGNIGLNRSREHNCPNLAALAKQNKTRLEQDNSGRRIFPLCDHCGLTTHSTERYWKNPNNESYDNVHISDQPSISNESIQNSSTDRYIRNNPLHLN